MSDKHTGGSKVIWAFGGGKGGSGRTLTVASLGVLLAEEGRDVILLDGDLEAPNLHTTLGMKRPDRTLMDYQSGRARSLNETVSPTPINNLRLIAGAPAAFSAAGRRNASRSKLSRRNLQELRCEILLIDLGYGAGQNSVELLLASDTGILVTTLELSSIELVYRYLVAMLYRRLKGMDGMSGFDSFMDEEISETKTGDMIAMIEKLMDRAGVFKEEARERIEQELFDLDLKLIVNMARDGHDRFLGSSICEIVEKFYGFEMDYVGYIPYDDRVAQAGKLGKLFVLDYSSSEAAACFHLIQRELLKNVRKRPGASQLSLIRS